MERSGEWDPGTYHQHAEFVPRLGLPVLDLLAPQPGERILDVGCGDGALSQELVNRGALVVGVDASPEMVAGARERGTDAHTVDAESLAFNAEFDAAFSNAALHWMRRPDLVLAGVARALAPGGRFVGEMGGHGNVPSVTVAMSAILRHRGHDPRIANPWFFPTPLSTNSICGWPDSLSIRSRRSRGPRD